MTSPRVAVVVGNPKPQSRTLSAACRLAGELAGCEPDLVVDLAEYGPRLFDRSDAEVSDLVEQVAAADLVIVATPTYKASFTGLLKLFLDRFGAGSITGVAVPLMLGGSPAHSLAPEFALRPVLTEISATSPAKGLYVVDADHDDPAAYAGWLEANRGWVQSLVQTITQNRSTSEVSA